MPTPFISNSRRRRRRWPWIIAILAVLAAGGAAAVYLTYGKNPEDITNPNAEFQDTEDQPATPEEPAKKKRKGETFVWETYGYTDNRTRYFASDLKPPFKELWTYKAGAGELIEFQPALANGNLYFLRNHGVAVALSAKTGHIKWQTRIGELNASSPAYYKGRLYVTTLSPGQALCLDAKTGKILWRKKLPARTESSPLVMNKKMYFGSEDGTVYAIRTKDGSNVWTYKAAGAVKAALAHQDGKLFFGDYAGQVTAISAEKGDKIWGSSSQGLSFGRAGRFYSTPAVKFGRVYLGSLDGKVYSFVASSGQLAWSHSTGNYVYAAPAVARVPGTKPSVYIGSYDGKFRALDARSGKELWSYNAGGKISGAPTIIGNVVYFSNLAKKETSGVDVRTGKRVWKFARGSFNPAISDGKRLYITGYSTQHAFVPKGSNSDPDPSE